MPSNTKNYNKTWYDKNKEKHRKYVNEKITCNCGKQISRCNMSAHKKSQPHLQYMHDTRAQVTLDMVIDYLRKMGKSEEYITNFENEITRVEIST